LTATTYKTIADKAEGIYKDKGSKFLAFGFPVSSVENTREIITEIKKKHHGARHHCYAYRIGEDTCRMNDDGEPSNTAGKPIYNQLLAGNLTNIMVVVVRYFGGILLGTGGLTNAYKSATIDMLQNARIVSMTLCKIYKIEFRYDAADEVFRIIKEEKLEQKEQTMGMDCSIVTSIPVDKEKILVGRFKRINSVNITALD
jgi:uncharacterized YigZ family protein